jgi:hypothetical protein
MIDHIATAVNRFTCRPEAPRWSWSMLGGTCDPSTGLPMAAPERERLPLCGVVGRRWPVGGATGPEAGPCLPPPSEFRWCTFIASRPTHRWERHAIRVIKWAAGGLGRAAPPPPLILLGRRR